MKSQPFIEKTYSYQEKIIELQQKFRQICLSYGASISYSEIFLKSFEKDNNKNKQEQYQIKAYTIADEINLLKKGQSVSQIISSLLAERQEVLRSLRQKLVGIKNEKQIDIAECCQELSHLRMYNLAIIEHLTALSQKLSSGSSRYMSQVYYELLLNMQFLRTTALRKYIQFSNHQDPLLLMPYKRFKDHQEEAVHYHKSVAELFAIDPQYVKRLKKADKAFKTVIGQSQLIKPQYTQNEAKQNLEFGKDNQSEFTNRLKIPKPRNFHLPSIDFRSRVGYKGSTQKNRSHSYSKNLHEIIQDYENRERIKRKYDRYIFNQQKTKKRAVTQAKQYSKLIQKPQASSNDLAKQSPSHRLKSRLLYIDDNNDDSHQYQSQLNSNQNYITIQPQVDKDQHQINQNQKKQITPMKNNFTSKEQQKPQNQLQQNNEQQSGPKGINENLIAKVKSNKMRHNKIGNRIENEKCKETIYKIFTSTNRREIITSEKKYLPSHLQSLYAIDQNDKQKKIRSTIEQIEKISGKGKKHTQRSHSAQNDEIIDDNRYKNPFDVLHQIRDQKQYIPEENIEQNDHQELTIQDTSKISSSQYQQNTVYQQDYRTPQKIDQRLIKQLLFAIQRSSEFQLSSHKIDEKIQPKRQKQPQKQKNHHMQSPNSKNNQEDQTIRLSPTTQDSKSISNRKQNKKRLNLVTQFNIHEHIMVEKEKEQETTPKLNNQSHLQINSQQQFKAECEIILIQPPPAFHKVSQPQPTINQTNMHGVLDKQQQSRIRQQDYIKKQNKFEIDALNQHLSQKNAEFARVGKQNHENVSKIEDPNQNSSQKNAEVSRVGRQNYINVSKIEDPNQNLSQKSAEVVRVGRQSNINNSFVDHSIIDDANQSNILSVTNRSPTYINIFLTDELEEKQAQIHKKAKISSIKFNESKSHQSQVPSYSKQQTAILKKCVFQSKSMQQSQLIVLIKSFNSKNGSKLFELTRNSSYFTNRHIGFSTCSYNEEVICYCLTSPYLTPHTRYIFILHLEILKESFITIAPQLISTFIKYILFHDPANKLIYLRLRDIFDSNYANYFTNIKCYTNAIKTPLKSSSFDEISYLFERKQQKCNKSEDYTTIFNTIALFLTTKNSNSSFSTPKNKDIEISSPFLSKVESMIKGKQVKRFTQYQQLQKYLELEHLPRFREYDQRQGLILYEMILEDCLINARYFVHLNYFYFTIEPPYTYFWQTKDLYYLLISTSVKNKYYLIADKIYEESEHIDLYKNFKSNVMNRKLSDQLTNQKKVKGKIIGCPKFQKKVQFKISENTSGVILFELNWKEYIKGPRYLRQDAIFIELIGPFLCALVDIGEDNIIKHIYSTTISREHIQK